MNAAFQAGLFDQLNENINKRHDDANEYFQRQMEIASARGLKSREQTQAAMAGGLTAARQLAQVGVPRDIVISIAKQNPDDIPAFLDKVQKLQEKGVNTNEEFFRKFIQVSGEQAQPDQTIEQAFSEIYGNLATYDPETINRDPEGSFFSSIMGYNAMEQADRKLAEAGAFASTEPNIGSNIVTMDASLAGQALADLEGDDELSITDRDKLLTRAGERYLQLRNDWEEKNQTSWATSPDFPEEQLKRQAAEEVGVDFSEIQDIPSLRKTLEGGQGVESQDTFVRDLGDGTSVWIVNGIRVRRRNK